MGAFERKVWTELRELRESEADLQARYKTLHSAGAETGPFMLSLRILDERARQLESLLESAL